MMDIFGCFLILRTLIVSHALLKEVIGLLKLNAINARIDTTMLLKVVMTETVVVLSAPTGKLKILHPKAMDAGV